MWIALDTATDRAALALEIDGRRWQAHLDGARRHATSLLPMLDALLAEASASLASLQGVVVADRPGSFTGVRVGATVAKALTAPRRLELWAAPSLMGRARTAAAPDGALVVAIANALRGEVYAAAYRMYPARVETVLAPGVWRPVQLRGALPAPAVMVGDAPAAELEALAGWAERLVVWPASAPDAGALLELRRCQGGAQRVAEVDTWEPAYGRPAEAQARWEAVHGRALPDPGGSAA